jgi:hypothetical protein
VARAHSPWINLLAGFVGALVMAIGAYGLMIGNLRVGAFWAVIGFLVLGWAILDRRRFLRGTPESEVDGGHTIE